MRGRTAILLSLVIVVWLVWNSADFFFHRPYYEYWDSAANSLSILRAKHFAQLYGPYSRYDFHHPGPAFFYVQAFGEWLFHDVGHLVPSPFQGQLLINLCLMAGFFVASLSIFAQWLPARRRWIFLCAAFLIGIPHFSLMGNLPSLYNLLGGPSAFLSSWSGHNVVVPFLCLLMASASVGAGQGRHLPVLVIAGGFLMEHVAEALFVGSMAVVAYGGLLVNCMGFERARTGEAKPTRHGWIPAAWREYPKAHAVAGALLALFALPMVIDLSFGKESNLAAILHHVHEQANDRKSAECSLFYFLQYGAYTAYQVGTVEFGHYDRTGFLNYLRAHAGMFAGWTVVALLVWQAPVIYLRTLARRRAGATVPRDVENTRRFLAWAALFNVLAIGLSLYWGTRQDGPMFYFNSWFNFAIYYFGGLIAAGVLCTIWPVHASSPGAVPESRAVAERWRAVRLAGVGLVAFVCLVYADLLRIHDFDADKSSGTHASVALALAASDAEHPAAYKVLCFPPDDWPTVVGVGLQIARAGEKFITSGRWQIAFGQEHGWRSVEAKSLQDGLCPWYIMAAGTRRPGVAEDAPVYPLANGAQLMLTPPTLDLPAAVGGTAKIDFKLNGNAADFVLVGWGRPDQGGSWSDEPRATLAFRPQPVEGTNVEVTMDGEPFVSPAHGLSKQRLRLLFNGKPVSSTQELSKSGSVRFILPATAWNAEAAKVAPVASLTFDFPDAVTPASLEPGGRNVDMRVLGIFFHEVRLRVEP